MFTAAIFEMDGLLIDSERTFMDAWIGAAQRLGLALRPEDYAAVIGLTDTIEHLPTWFPAGGLAPVGSAGRAP